MINGNIRYFVFVLNLIESELLAYCSKPVCFCLHFMSSYCGTPLVNSLCFTDSQEKRLQSMNGNCVEEKTNHLANFGTIL